MEGRLAPSAKVITCTRPPRNSRVCCDPPDGLPLQRRMANPINKDFPIEFDRLSSHCQAATPLTTVPLG